MTEYTRFERLVAEAKKKITEISPTDAAAKAKSSDAVIVDVREKDEFDESHIPDAVHMSRGMSAPWPAASKPGKPLVYRPRRSANRACIRRQKFFKICVRA
ncbi:MAG TPA: rhodanese-like domain-containing protein [Chthoniobacterales bacterium]|nr:rhodanese-like domain-containing protein [Chthoniobacterales bacterium]